MKERGPESKPVEAHHAHSKAKVKLPPAEAHLSRILHQTTRTADSREVTTAERPKRKQLFFC